MALVEVNWQPTDRQLRQFGCLCLFALPLVAWLWSASLTVIGCCAIAGLVLALASWIYPAAVAPVFIGLMLVTTPIGIVIGEFAMLMIYLAVFLPIGLLFRLLGRDRLQLKKERQAESYWTTKKRPTSVASYYRQS